MISQQADGAGPLHPALPHRATEPAMPFKSLYGAEKLAPVSCWIAQGDQQGLTTCRSSTVPGREAASSCSAPLDQPSPLRSLSSDDLLAGLSAEEAAPVRGLLVADRPVTRVTAAEGAGRADWASMPDDIIVREVLQRLHLGYAFVLRAVCKGWRTSAARYITRLRPERLDGSHLAQRFPELRTLDLSFCANDVVIANKHTLAMQSQLTDEDLRHLSHLPNLTEVSLRECSKLQGGPGFETLRLLTGLTSLDLGECQAIVPAAMHVVAALPNLAELDLRGCSLLDDSALAVLQPMRKLRALKLGRQLEVTDAGLDTLATFHGLEVVGLAGLPSITDSGFHGLLQLPTLRILTVAHCNGIHEEALATASRREGLTLHWKQPVTRQMRTWLALVSAMQMEM